MDNQTKKIFEELEIYSQGFRDGFDKAIREIRRRFND